MYSFRYTDVYLGTITAQFNDRSSDNIFCICSRVTVREGSTKNRNRGNRKRPYNNNQFLEYKSTFQRDYVCDQTADQSLNEPIVSPVDGQSSQSINVEKDDADNNDVNDQVSNSCGFCCFSQLLRILREKFIQRRYNRLISEERSNPAEEDCCEISKAESICNKKTDSILVENSVDERTNPLSNNDPAGTIVKDDDLIKLGLSHMGYAFDVNETESRRPFQRITLRYSEAQISRINKGLILRINPPADSTNFSEDKAIEMGRQNRTKKHNAKRHRQHSPSEHDRKNYPSVIESNRSLSKYWDNRYRLFSKYDEGIQMDEESWYSVTPEKVSEHISDRCCSNFIIDAFCGAGGNTIQFAKTCERVLAIDIDPTKIKMAKHNAEIYGIADRIEFIVGNFFDLAPSLVADVVFLSPPWGGPAYTEQKIFPLQNIMEPYGGKYLYEMAKNISPSIAFYLPRNVNLHEVYQLVGSGGCVEVEQNFLERKLVAVTAYFDELVNDEELSEDE